MPLFIMNGGFAVSSSILWEAGAHGGNWMSTVFVTLMGNMCDCDRQELAVALHCFPQSPPERDIDRERETGGRGIMRERDGKERKSYISREIRSRQREEEIEK